MTFSVHGYKNKFYLSFIDKNKELKLCSPDFLCKLLSCSLQDLYDDFIQFNINISRRSTLLYIGGENNIFDVVNHLNNKYGIILALMEDI